MRVGLLTGESGLAVIRETLQRIAWPHINPANVENLIISDRVPRISNPAHLDAVRQLIVDNKLKVLRHRPRLPRV